MEHKEGKTGVEALKSQQSPPASVLPIAGDVRKNSWDRIRAGGKIDLTDIAGVGVATRRKFEESGFWSPSDFFKAYAEGRVEELAALANDLRITKGGSGVDVIAGEIVAAPEAHMTADKAEIAKNIKNAKPGVSFLDRRADEIKEYLEKIGFVENRPVVVSLVNRGENLTHEAAAEAEAAQQTSPAARAGPVTVMIGQKAVRGMGDLKKKAKDAVFDRAMRDAMTGMGGKFGVGMDRFFENISKVSPKITADEKLLAKAKAGFVKSVTTDFILNKVLVQDPDIGQRGNLRPSDSEMARYLFSSRAKFRIGDTNNFDIPRLAKFASAGQSILKSPGELVFEDPSKTGNIRLTGHVLVKSKKDMDKLVKILGTNPKNGFAPIGYEATDDAAKMAMDTFTVFARYVGGSNIVTPNVVDVSKATGKYVITVDDGKKIMHGADVHLWTYKPKEELASWAAKNLDETAGDMFGKKYVDLTPSEKESVIGSSEVVPAVFATNHEYAGSLCEVETGSKTIERLRAVDKLLNQFYFTGKSKDEKAAVGFVQAKIGEIKDGINGDSGTKGLVEKLGDVNKADIGTLNTGPKPNCLVVPSFDKSAGKIEVVTGADSKFVERKLDKAIAICSKMPSKFEKEGCFADWIVVSQNLTDGGAMEGKVYRAIDKAKTVLEQKDEATTEKVLLSIARKMAAGSWNEEKDPATNRTVDIKPDTKEKRDVLNAVKLLGNQPLGITPWKFLKTL